jgi:hypothetical protein
MALFMDIHSIDGGVSAADVAAAHQKDRETHGLVAESIHEVSEHS